MRFPNRTGTYKETVYERFYHKSGRIRVWYSALVRKPQINGMNAFDEYAYGIRHDSPPTGLGHLAFVKKTQEKPKTK